MHKGFFQISKKSIGLARDLNFFKYASFWIRAYSICLFYSSRLSEVQCLEFFRIVGKCKDKVSNLAQDFRSYYNARGCYCFSIFVRTWRLKSIYNIFRVHQVSLLNNVWIFVVYVREKNIKYLFLALAQNKNQMSSIHDTWCPHKVLVTWLEIFVKIHWGPPRSYKSTLP